ELRVWGLIDVFGKLVCVRIKTANLITSAFSEPDCPIGRNSKPGRPAVLSRNGKLLKRAALWCKPANLVACMFGEPNYAVDEKQIIGLAGRCGHRVRCEHGCRDGSRVCDHQ